MIQGAGAPGSILSIIDAVFAADRRYNSQEMIYFVYELLGATLIGTHKRNFDFPFVFGDGPVSKRHKGMVVSEKVYRACT